MAGTTQHRPQATSDWHALPPNEVLVRLDTDGTSGLSTAAAAQRVAEFGPNTLGEHAQRSRLDLLLSQFLSPLMVILILAAVITTVLGKISDTIVISIILVFNAAIGYIQESRADRSVHALMQLAAPSATVVRDGNTRHVAATALTVGDVVLLESGDRIPADLRILDVTQLRIDESLLTDESLPVEKHVDPVATGALPADQTSMLFKGSTVTQGRARGVVTAIGDSTQLGDIAVTIRRQERPKTPLQLRMNRFAYIITFVIVAATLGAFLLGLALGNPVDEMFLTAVALAVAVIPEGLPIGFTVAMALGVRRMAAHNTVVRSLPAVETLGSTTVIGSDKTGTLTANQMTVIEVYIPGRHVTAPFTPDQFPQLAAAIDTAAYATEAELVIEDGVITARRSDPTENALLAFAHDCGADVNRARTVVASLPFESDRQYMYVIVDYDGPVLHIKGAPERVLARCDTQLGEHGVEPCDRAAAQHAQHEMARNGLRVLAGATLRLNGTEPFNSATFDPSGLRFTGLYGLQDPPRAGVIDAIADARGAGVRVVMITSDHADTARAIATQLGLADNTAVRTGDDIEQATDEELAGDVTHVNVFARVTPEHKLRIVNALHAHGHVVAVTGDGVNDGPALKAADIGVAMGRDGTDVAREASDIVLTDDNFVSIAHAITEGRVVFANVRKLTYFLLSTAAATMTTIFVTLLAGIGLPYTPAALLWLNVVTNGVQDVAFAFEPAEADVMDEPPRTLTEGIVSRVLWERAVVTGAMLAAGSLWLYVWAQASGATVDAQRGAALTALVIGMAVHAFNARSTNRSLFRVGVTGNRMLFYSSLIAVGLHVVALHLGVFQTLLGIGPFGASGWWRIAAVAAGVVAVSEAHKWWWRPRPASATATSR